MGYGALFESKDKRKSTGSNIDGLAKDAREFRKNYPVYCLVLSHPSTPAKDSLARWCFRYSNSGTKDSC